MSSRPERELHAHNALLYWAYESVPTHQWADLSNVFESARARFRGTQLTWSEVMDAVKYLQSAGLVEVLDYAVGDRTSLHLVRPSANGRWIAEAGGNVTEYLDAKQSGDTGLAKVDVNIHHASRIALAIGDSNTQTVVAGVDSFALITLIAELRSVAPHLGLPSEDTEDLLADIDSLGENADDPKAGARVWRNIKRFLSAALKSENIALAAKVGAEVSPERVEAVIKAGESLF